jgi:hypothetical protein
VPKGYGETQEQHGSQKNPSNRRAGERCASGCRGGDPGHDGQDDETQDVVKDRRTENNLSLWASYPAEIPQHPGGDADAGGR